MKIMVLIVLVLFIALFCTGCFLDLYTTIIETEPILPGDEVLVKIFENGDPNDKNIRLNARGELFLPVGIDPDLGILKEILDINGMIKEISGIAKITFSEVAREEVSKNMWIPHRTRQYKCLLRIGTGERQLMQIGEIIVPLEALELKRKNDK